MRVSSQSLTTRQRPHDPPDWERDPRRALLAVHAGCGGPIVQREGYRPSAALREVVCWTCGRVWRRRDQRYRWRGEDHQEAAE